MYYFYEHLSEPYCNIRNECIQVVCYIVMYIKTSGGRSDCMLEVALKKKKKNIYIYIYIYVNIYIYNII